MPAPPMRWFAAACVLVLTGCAQGSDPAGPRPTATATATAHTMERPVRPSARPAGESLDRAGYLAVADALSARLSPLWDARHARYRAGRGTITNVNADLLIVHSTAALARHRGAARDDARAVAIVRFLTSPPVWAGPGQGWQAGPGQPGSARGLPGRGDRGAADGVSGPRRAGARRAAHRSGSSESGARRPRPAVALAGGPAQPAQLVHDLRPRGRGRQRPRPRARHDHAPTARPVHARGARDGRPRRQPRPRPALPLPADQRAAGPLELRLAGVREHRPRASRACTARARAAGMPRPAAAAAAARVDPARDQRLLDARRGPELGHGPRVRALAPAQEDRARAGCADRHRGRAGAAAEPALGRVGEVAARPGPDPVRRAHRPRRADPGRGGLRTWTSSRSGAAHAYLAASRQAANAMRALAAGLGAHRAHRPPPLYAFDPDTGRLAVTTPTYSTAIVPANQGAFPYGGLDLARLLDAEQDVAGTLGGTGSAGFGLRVGHLRTQYGTRLYAPATQPLQLVRAPQRVRAPVTALRAYAGPFRDLRVRGSRPPAGTVEYRFTRRTIRARWTASGPGGVVTFPSWGRSARIERVSPGVYAIHSERAGYTVRLRGVREHADRPPATAEREPRSRPDARGRAHREPPRRDARAALTGRNGTIPVVIVAVRAGGSARRRARAGGHSAPARDRARGRGAGRERAARGRAAAPRARRHGARRRSGSASSARRTGCGPRTPTAPSRTPTRRSCRSARRLESLGWAGVVKRGERTVDSRSVRTDEGWLGIDRDLTEAVPARVAVVRLAGGRRAPRGRRLRAGRRRQRARALPARRAARARRPAARCG